MSNPNEIIRASLDGLENLKPADIFKEPKYLENNSLLPQKQPVDLINDNDLISPIDQIIDKIKNRDAYHWCCLVIIRLLQNTKCSETGEYLVDKIKAENEIWKIKDLTSALSATCGGYTERISELIYLLEHPNKTIRGNMISTLKFSRSPLLEDPLISIISNSKDAYEILFSLWTLQGVVTKKSIEILRELLYHIKQDIKISSLSAIAKVLKEEGCELYLNLLTDKNYRDKDIVTCYIRAHCLHNGVPAICERIKTVLSRKRGRPLIFRRPDRTETTELVLNIEFLTDYYSRFNLIENTYKLIEKKWDKIHEIERDDIQNAITNSRL